MIQRTPQFPSIEMMRIMANTNVHRIESTVHGSDGDLKRLYDNLCHQSDHHEFL